MCLLLRLKDNLLPTKSGMVQYTLKHVAVPKIIKGSDAQHANLIKAHTISSAVSTAKVEMQSRTMQCTSCGLELTQLSV